MRKTSNATLRFGNFWNQTSSALREGDSELDCFAQRHLRYFVHHHFVGNAAQCRVLLDRPDLLFLQDRDHPGGFDHRCGDMDLLRRRQALHPRGDVDVLAEIILPFVEHDRKTWAFMDADLDDQVLAAALFVELTHRSAHFQARHQRVFGTNERRHHRIADGLHHGTFLRRDDVEQRAEMRAHQIERGEVPDPLIERSRPLQVGEQESQRGDLQPLTFLFTDLKGSTALYERVGDLAAFDLVRAHFRALLDIIASEKGAVVKTIGDAVMATFIRPENALMAGLRMRAAMDDLNKQRDSNDLIVKIGIHEGPCLAVMLNERQDYFGQTVNIASRVQSLSTSQEIHVTGPVIDAPGVATILEKEALRPIQKEAALRGIADKIVVYEIP